jgi:serine/threonine-protein kinase
MSDVVDRLNAALEGRYRIERELGEGGMANVYLAEDLKHDRSVALKVLKPELAAVVGGERFLAEIKTTAQLQHPHILPLHHSGEADSFLFYVMPYIEGESLRERLEREQQLPVEEAIGIAEKVAAALQYAHEQGVVHRDIKPANILLNRGEPLVADFGIALAVSQAGGGRITETGLSLGTPHYMSPEQAAGERALDKRSDVYALGCVLYEMLTGQPPFGGPSAQAVLGRILTGEADPVTAHRKAVPANVEAAVHTSLERLPADRFESAKVFAEALRNPSFGADRAAGGAGIGASGSAGRWRLATLVASAVAVAAVVVAVLASRPGDPPPVRRYSVELPGQTLGTAVVGNRFAISPDGSRIAFVGAGETGQIQLWLRAWDQLQSQPISGTDFASMPAFSPDGRRVAFGTRSSELAVMSLGGEPPLSFPAPGNQTYGLSWGPDDMLYYAGSSGIVRIPPGGGEPEQVTRLDSTGEFLHMYPQALPGGRGLIYTSVAGAGANPDAFWVEVADLETAEVRARVRGVFGVYAASGHLLVVTSFADGRLVAVPFDLSSLEVTGDAVALTQGIGFSVNGVDLALSGDGTLVYRQASAGGDGLVSPVVVSRDGVESVLDSEWKGTFTSLAVSPDGDRLAASITEPSGGEHIWMKDLGGGPPAKRTFEGQNNQRPEWTTDGRYVIIYANRQGGFDLWRVRADGSEPMQLFLDEDRDVVEAEMSPDGGWLVYRTNALQAPGADILAKRLDINGAPEGDPITLVGTPASERTPTFSPDGRWFAYVSDESGNDEIYVRPFPDANAARWQVSVQGGTEPLWSRGGGEIFYRRADGDMVAVSVRTEPTFATGERRVLFPAGNYYADYNHRAYDVLPGDTAFVMIPLGQGGADHLVVVDNLFTELKEKVGG